MAREPTTVREEGAEEDLGDAEKEEKRRKRFSQQLACMMYLYDQPGARDLLLDSDRVTHKT